MASRLVLLALAGCSPGLQSRLDGLGATPCELDPSFSCGSLDVPLDPDAPDDGALPFAFAVRPADEDSLGPLVIVDGGPGQPGLAGIDDLAYIDPALSARFDLVYFNLRGTGEPDGFYCRDAVNTWVSTPWHLGDAADGAIVSAAAAALSSACVAESGWTEEEVAALRTDRAAGDIEALRDALGAEVLTLYGLSYGTQLSQEYASTYPERVRALVIDGVVDLTLRDIDYATSLAQTTNDVLDGALAACDAEPACLADDLASAWDVAAARLETAVLVPSPMPDGTIRVRPFTRGDLDTVVLFASDDPHGRAFLLRAILAAARRDDFVPLRRLLDAAGGLDPLTDQYDSGEYSDAVYYAVTCNDYGRTEGGVDAWLARADDLAGERVNSALSGDLPCATWPTAGAERDRPEPFFVEAPVMVVNATADVATPSPMGENVLEALRSAGGDARGVHVDGGHHVTWGDSACADPAITGFLLDPSDPSVPQDLDCDGGWLSGYAPLGPTTTADLDAAAIGEAVATEVLMLPWFPYVGDVGCDRGGAITVDDDQGLRFVGCRFTDDLTLDGDGAADAYAGTVAVTVTVSGAHTGTLTITREEGETTVTGALD